MTNNEAQAGKTKGDAMEWTDWTETTDGNVLAAALDADGEVEYLWLDGVWYRTVRGADDYRSRGCNSAIPYRFSIPVPTTPEPPFPGALATGRVVDGEPTWIALDGAGRVPREGWETRYATFERWAIPSRWHPEAIVEARRIPAPPKPRTVRVHWSEAVGREDPDNGLIERVEHGTGSVPLVSFVGGGFMSIFDPDGTVEVLARDGES